MARNVLNFIEEALDEVWRSRCKSAKSQSRLGSFIGFGGITGVFPLRRLSMSRIIVVGLSAIMGLRSAFSIQPGLKNQIVDLCLP